MTFRVKKRGKTYRLEGRAGDRLRRGTGERERIRLSLGTANGDAAQLLHSRIERALAEGPTSRIWAELRATLPSDTFSKLASIAGYSLDEAPDVPKPTWADLAAKFSAWMSQRVALITLRDSPDGRYLQNLGAFAG